MDHMQSMLNKLRPLNLYSLERSTTVYDELRVYTIRFDELENEINSLFQEAFTATAEDYGIYMWEKLWGLERGDLTLEERRAAIADRLSIPQRGCTRQDVIRFFASMGAEASLTEDFRRHRLYIHITNGARLSKETRKYITAQAIEFLPAHLNVYVDYRTGGWDTLDAKQNTFDDYDRMALTFDQLEQYE